MIIKCSLYSGKGTDLFVHIFALALNQGHQFAGTGGFKQEPKEMSFYGLLAISEIGNLMVNSLERNKLARCCMHFCNWSTWKPKEKDGGFLEANLLNSRMQTHPPPP